MKLLKTFFLLVVVALCGPVHADDPVISFSDSDPVMNAAIADARRTLPLFYERFSSVDPKEGTVLLKVAMPYVENGKTGHEHIWATVLSHKSGTFEALLANDPVHIDFEAYDLITFTENDISDWLYYDDAGLMHGAFTLRVIMKNLPADQAESIRQSLAPPPPGTGPYD